MVFQGENCEPNALVLNIQPDEGISLTFGAKSPGGQMHIQPGYHGFPISASVRLGSRDAYATLINDCIRGDATLFDRADSVEAAWSLVDPLLDTWKTTPAPAFPNYAAGSRGPKEADDLVATGGQRWCEL